MSCNTLPFLCGHEWQRNKNTVAWHKLPNMLGLIENLENLFFKIWMLLFRRNLQNMEEKNVANTKFFNQLFIFDSI